MNDLSGYVVSGNFKGHGRQSHIAVSEQNQIKAVMCDRNRRHSGVLGRVWVLVRACEQLACVYIQYGIDTNKRKRFYQPPRNGHDERKLDWCTYHSNAD